MEKLWKRFTIEGMADITQITGSDIIMFSAESHEADSWMREFYDRHKIYFNLPYNHTGLLAFKVAAKAQGLSIAKLAADPADTK